MTIGGPRHGPAAKPRSILAGKNVFMRGADDRFSSSALPRAEPQKRDGPCEVRATGFLRRNRPVHNQPWLCCCVVSQAFLPERLFTTPPPQPPSESPDRAGLPPHRPFPRRMPG